MRHVLAANFGLVCLCLAGLGVRDANWEVVFPQSPLSILVLNMAFLSITVMVLMTAPPVGDPMESPPIKSRSAVTREVLADVAAYGGSMAVVSTAAFVACLYGLGRLDPLSGRTTDPADLIGVKCNGHGHGEERTCAAVYAARSAVFLLLSGIIIFNSFSVQSRYAVLPVVERWERRRQRRAAARSGGAAAAQAVAAAAADADADAAAAAAAEHGREDSPSFFNRHGHALSVLTVIGLALLLVYTPTLNDVFRQGAPLSGAGWGVIAAGLLIHVAFVTAWKHGAKRLAFPQPRLRRRGRSTMPGCVVASHGWQQGAGGLRDE